MLPTLMLRTLASLCFLPGDSYFKTCNRWAYTYIGLYGYNFNEAGFRAKQLFETREWTSVVNDNLVYNILWMASVAIGGWTGTFGVLVQRVDGYEFTSFHHPISTAFV
jgi:Plasma-membrane choline transporter